MHDFIVHAEHEDIVEELFHQLFEIRRGLAVDMSGLRLRRRIELAFQRRQTNDCDASPVLRLFAHSAARELSRLPCAENRFSFQARSR